MYTFPSRYINKCMMWWKVLFFPPSVCKKLPVWGRWAFHSALTVQDLTWFRWNIKAKFSSGCMLLLWKRASRGNNFTVISEGGESFFLDSHKFVCHNCWCGQSVNYTGNDVCIVNSLIADVLLSKKPPIRTVRSGRLYVYLIQFHHVKQ